MFRKRFDIDLAHVPYRNSPQSIADVAAGHVAMAFAEAGASLPLIRDGKLRALAVTSSTRLPTVPELPPFGEAVGAPDFEAVSWHVLLAPAGTPPDAIDKLHGEMKRIMEAPDMKKKVADIGLIPLDIASVEQSRAYIKAEGEKWGKKLVKQMYRILTDNGMLLIAEMIPNDTRSGPMLPLLFGLNMLVHTEAGDVFTMREYRQWLKDAGFRKVQALDVPGPSPLILATK